MFKDKNGFLQLHKNESNEYDYFLQKYEELDAAEDKKEYNEIFGQLSIMCCSHFISCRECPFDWCANEIICTFPPLSLNEISAILRGEYKLQERD